MDGIRDIRDIADVINIDVLQSIQDVFAEATGIAFVSVDYRGHPITRTSGFTDFCKKMRANDTFCQRCFFSDAHGGLNATVTGEPYFYHCHSSLVDFAVPLFLQGGFIGAMLCGQVKIPASDEKEAALEYITKATTEWHSDPELLADYEKVNVVPFSKIKSVAALMQKMLQYMIDEQFKNMVTDELNKKQQELDEEKNKRISLEEALKVRRFLDFQNRYGLDFIFYILNVISKLAYKENASETENTVCDFSDMLRYLSDNSHNRLVTLEDELKYLKCFAAIQKRRLEGSFECNISVPQEYFGVPCPFMLMHVMLENVLKYAFTSDSEVSLSVAGEESKGKFLLDITCSGVPFDDEHIRSSLTMEEVEEAQSGKVMLSTLNRRIKSLFGDAFGISVEKREGESLAGTFRVCLPLSAGSTAN